ncbi:MAG: hypothetical protein AAB592_00715 [Patescibacteria group bacterium]
MLKDQCISVTDLRVNTKQCLADLNKEPKYIFVNNKPVAVLIDIVQFETDFVRPRLVQLDHNAITPALQKKADEAAKTSRKDLFDV